MNLVFIRHGQSLWNLENKFTGWVDIDLSERGEVEAKTAVVTLIDNNFYPEICFTSYLKRSINTAAHITENFKNMNITYENVKKWELNERHYGALQGLDKIETAKKYGQEQVQIWRRSFDTPPPLAEKNSEHDPKTHELYNDIESLKSAVLTRVKILSPCSINMDSFFGGCSNLYTPGDKSKNLSENLFSWSKKIVSIISSFL